MTPDLFQRLVAEARLAPSVHNVQPARWRLNGNSFDLFEDKTVRLSAGDPRGHDAAISMGAAIEGMSLAARKRGLALTETDEKGNGHEDLRFVARFTVADAGSADPLADHVEARQSWRGPFVAPTPQDRDAVRALNSDDCAVVADHTDIVALAKVIDDASFGFMARADFRAELLSWMRLRRGHPKWAQDGLNADAMGLGAVERTGASLVMGPLFKPLNAIRLAAPLLAEAAKTESAAAILLFHRPEDEVPLVSGRAFYRVWLEMEAAGFGAAVLAALADDPKAASVVTQMANISPDRRLVSAFRIGRRPAGVAYARARRAADDIIV
ncbi:hypothetical protein MWU60_11565 [Yoonia sp. F2084L]|uniref:hypothetical protein n=1 Tax=Yoonia sp. F2084L TaxID=2926419 RepID=UPI001FF39D26|nr:hypothetical protein [Yoonia sp. F2084L]MCK0096211.1 hypothetical protein [Yoonia sp. F2084L]